MEVFVPVHVLEKYGKEAPTFLLEDPFYIPVANLEAKSADLRAKGWIEQHRLDLHFT